TGTAPALVELRTGQDTQRVPQHLLIPCGGAQSAKRPGWPLPGGVGAELGLHLRRRHAFVVVPRAVVGPHMLQAEPPVLGQAAAGLRSTVFAGGTASGHVAGPSRGSRVGSVGPGSHRASRHSPIYVRPTGELATSPWRSARIGGYVTHAG